MGKTTEAHTAPILPKPLLGLMRALTNTNTHSFNLSLVNSITDNIVDSRRVGTCQKVGEEVHHHKWKNFRHIGLSNKVPNHWYKKPSIVLRSTRL